MSMRRPAGLALLLLVACATCGRSGGGTPARPLIVLIGDSTTAGYGGPDGYAVASETPLAALLADLPATSRWHRAEVVNLGIPNTTTHEWAEASLRCRSAPELGADVHAGFRLAAHACLTGAPLASEVAPFVGRPIDLVLVVLGTNDPYRDPAATPEQAVANLRAIAARLAPARVLIASPFWTTHPARAAFVESLAARLQSSGLLTGPDFAHIHLPLDASQVHLTYGGFAAGSGLWLDALRALP